ncbi:MAG TPA: class I SAM-dependent methyltransferase [Allosphingosinicella sp.]
MYYVLTSREALIRQLPRGGVGAEIGVAKGTFAAAILEAAEPRELHLIDPWSHLETGPDPLQASGHLESVDRALGGTFAPPAANAQGDSAFAAVEARFAGDSRVRLHRQFSYKAAPGFADGSFDFVYIDGDHRFEFVLRDLQDFAAKLKPGGLMFGHDFFEDDFARREHYGVIEAVNAFIKRSDFRFLMLTAEPFSTFCLARRLDGFAGGFLRNMLESEAQMVEIPDSIASNYRDKSYRRRDGSTKRIPSFMSARQFQLA